MSSLALSVKLPQFCISSGMIYFHKHSLLKETLSHEDKVDITIIAALFVASKTCNALISLQRLIQAYITLKGKGSLGSTELDELKESIIKTEFDILNSIGFDLNVDLPYIYIEKMKPYITDCLKNDKLMKIIYNFLNDSFKLPLILYYAPIKIALSALYLVGVHFKVDLINTKEGKKWYTILSTDDETIDEIIEISNMINQIYLVLRNKNKQPEENKSNLLQKGDLTLVNDSLNLLKDKLEMSLLGKKRDLSGY